MDDVRSFVLGCLVCVALWCLWLGCSPIQVAPDGAPDGEVMSGLDGVVGDNLTPEERVREQRSETGEPQRESVGEKWSEPQPEPAGTDLPDAGEPAREVKPENTGREVGDGGEFTPRPETVPESEPASERVSPEPLPELGPPGSPWAIALGDGASQIYSDKIAVTPQGEIIITGRFIGQMSVGGKTYQSNAVGGFDAFLAALDQQGKLLWFSQITGNDSKWIRELIVDPQGHLYITGGFFGTIQLGAKTYTNTKGGGCFVAKFDGQGKILWSVQAGGSGADTGKALAIGPGGDLYMAGEFDGKASFGTVSIPDSRFSDVFVARLSPQGDFRWVATTKGVSSGFATSIAVDSQGAIYVLGQFFDAMTVGTSSLQAQQMDIFVARLDATGKWQWAVQSAGAGLTVPYRLRLDNAGNPYIVGETGGNKTFGKIAINSPPHGDIFLARMTPQGSFVWLSRSKNFAHVHPYSIEFDSRGRLFVAGDYNGQPAFDTHTLPNTQSFQTFIAQATAQGSFPWAVATQGSQDVNTRWLAIDAQDNLLLLGDFQESAQLGSILLKPGKPQRYLFVWRYPRP